MKIHLSQSVRGALNNWKKSDFKNAFVREDGTKLTAEEAKEFLLDCLSEGKEKIPLGKPCKGYDYKKGCPGHEEI